MKKYLIEFLGTFFLVLAVVLTVNNPGIGNLAPLAIGSMLMVVIYAGGHISGAHYNPAVTLAVYLRGKISLKDVIPYWAAQIIGAVLAAITAGYILSNMGLSVTQGDFAGFAIPGMLAEFLGTFLLAFVILNVATSSSTSGNSYYGLAIGFTVVACAYTLGGITGGAFNPAVAIGVTLAEMSKWSNIWIILTGTFTGGALAAIIFNYLDEGD